MTVNKHTHQCPSCSGFWTCYNKACKVNQGSFTFDGVEYRAGCHAKRQCPGCLDIRELAEWQKYTGAPPKEVRKARAHEKAWLAAGGAEKHS